MPNATQGFVQSPVVTCTNDMLSSDPSEPSSEVSTEYCGVDLQGHPSQILMLFKLISRDIPDGWPQVRLCMKSHTDFLTLILPLRGIGFCLTGLPLTQLLPCGWANSETIEPCYHYAFVREI